MSTSYYALRPPVVRVESRGALAIAVDTRGHLVASVRPDCLHILANRDEKVAHRSANRTVVLVPGADDVQAISEYGELVTLGQLRRGEAP